MKIEADKLVNQVPSLKAFVTVSDQAEIEKVNSEPKVQIVNKELQVPHFAPRIIPASLLTHFLLFDSSDPDLQRYNEILKGKAREELKKFKSPKEMIAKKGDKLISIPVPQIGIPHFTRGGGKGGGAGQGEGEIGESLGSDGEDGGRQVGDQPGGHINEVWVPLSRSEIAKTIIEHRKLPYLKPKGYGVAKEKTIKWNTKSRVGIDMDLQATIINALKRVGAETGDQFDLETEEGLNAFLDKVCVEEQDKIYTSWREIEKPQVSLAIIYMMDVSGSMTDEQKETVRTTAWYLDTIIEYMFGVVRADLRGDKFSDDQSGEGIKKVYIVHDAAAREVTEEEFYTTRESGGTKISSAYEVAKKVIKERFDPETWNVYAFHFSDGDNWGDDIPHCIELIKELAEQINEFGYVQVESPYGSGEFLGYVKPLSEDMGHVRTSKIDAASSDAYGKLIDDLLGDKGDKKD